MNRKLLSAFGVMIFLTGCSTMGERDGMGFFLASNPGSGASLGGLSGGHHDREGLRDDAPSKSWSSSHPSRGCSLPALNSTGGGGYFYCFAAD